MAEDLPQRAEGFLVGEDEALNALGGGSPRQTISGTVGRGVIAGKWWAPTACAAIEIMPWFGAGHCARQAALEATRSA